MFSDLDIPEDMREAFATLQREYLREAPARLAELHKDLAAFRSGEADAVESLRQRFHRLAGSGGSFGLPQVTAVARDMEQWILATTDHATLDPARIDQAITALKQAFDALGADPEPMPPTITRLPGFGWRALLVMAPGPARDTLAEELTEMSFTVAASQEIVDPLDVPPTEHPDLVIISTDAGIDTLGMARYWAAPTADRARAVVIADATGDLDRLRTAAVGVDAVYGPNELPRELIEFARAVAQTGAAPAKVLLVEDDPAQAQLFASWLSSMNASVSICTSAGQARETLASVTPDLVLLDVGLPDVDGYAVARLMRQEARLALVPIVFLTANNTLVDQLEGLRAGGDDFLAKPVDRTHLIQLAITRVERGRRIRRLVHRDSLTGILNHATLLGELEHATAYAVRHGEPLAFVMIDLDHFKRINDTWGHMVGDQVLAHATQVFRKQIREGDAIGRYGGEEFGVVLPACPAQDAVAFAERLRVALATSTLAIPGGEGIQVRASFGVAAYPESGTTATELTMAADRALYRAKSTGRNRVQLETIADD